MLRTWVNVLLIAAAAALVLASSGVSATSATSHSSDHMAMASPCGTMNMVGGGDPLPAAKAHCPIGCLMSAPAVTVPDDIDTLPDMAPCVGGATPLQPATLTPDLPPPRL